MASNSNGAPSSDGARVIFVGPDPIHAGRAGHAGGQLTAAVGIAGYAAAHGIHLEIVDTFVDSLSRLSMVDRVVGGIKRVRALRRLLKRGTTHGVILFVGARHSFFERVLLAGMTRARGVVTVFCIRDGAFTGWMQRSAVLKGIVSRLLLIPDHIVVQGTRAREALAATGIPPGKFIVVRNWLPQTFRIADSARDVAPGELVRLIYIGWLVEEKGLRELLDACAALAPRYSFELDLIGGGPLLDELREFSAAHGIRATFSGWLPAREVLGRLERAHVFVLPSYFEGFPNALLEAMACGLGSVCSDVGAIAESVHSGVNGFVVPSHDARALAAALGQYLATPSLVAAHGCASLLVVEAQHDRIRNLAELFSCITPA